MIRCCKSYRIYRPGDRSSVSCWSPARGCRYVQTLPVCRVESRAERICERGQPSSQPGRAHLSWWRDTQRPRSTADSPAGCIHGPHCRIRIQSQVTDISNLMYNFEILWVCLCLSVIGAQIVRFRTVIFGRSYTVYGVMVRIQVLRETIR